MSAKIVYNHLKGVALLSACSSSDSVYVAVPVKIANIGFACAHCVKVSEHLAQAVACGFKVLVSLDSAFVVTCGLAIDDIKSERTAQSVEGI